MRNTHKKEDKGVLKTFFKRIFKSFSFKKTSKENIFKLLEYKINHSNMASMDKIAKEIKKAQPEIYKEFMRERGTEILNLIGKEVVLGLQNGDINKEKTEKIKFLIKNKAFLSLQIEKQIASLGLKYSNNQIFKEIKDLIKQSHAHH